jgi:hypothetical protein
VEVLIMAETPVLPSIISDEHGGQTVPLHTGNSIRPHELGLAHIINSVPTAHTVAHILHGDQNLMEGQAVIGHSHMGNTEPEATKVEAHENSENEGHGKNKSFADFLKSLAHKFLPRQNLDPHLLAGANTIERPHTQAAAHRPDLHSVDGPTVANRNIPDAHIEGKSWSENVPHIQSSHSFAEMVKATHGHGSHEGHG